MMRFSACSGFPFFEGDVIAATDARGMLGGAHMTLKVCGARRAPEQASLQIPVPVCEVPGRAVCGPEAVVVVLHHKRHRASSLTHLKVPGSSSLVYAQQTFVSAVGQMSHRCKN